MIEGLVGVLRTLVFDVTVTMRGRRISIGYSLGIDLQYLGPESINKKEV